MENIFLILLCFGQASLGMRTVYRIGWIEFIGGVSMMRELKAKAWEE